MKEHLLNELKQYKSILNSEVIEYLTSLIELELSVLDESITLYDSMNLLINFDLCKKIIHYNIYEKALNVYWDQRKKYPIIIEKNNEQLFIKYIIDEENIIPIFIYNYLNGYHKINLYETYISPEIREQEIIKIKQKIELVSSQKNPYCSRESRSDGSPFSIWLMEQKAELSYLNQYLFELKNRNLLIEDNKYKASIYKYFTNLFIEEFKINKSSLKEVKNNSYLTKKLVKQYHNVKLTDNVTYY